MARRLEQCLANGFQACSGWIMRKSDTPEDIRIKRILTPLVMGVLLVGFFNIYRGLVGYGAMYVVSNVVWCVGFTYFLVRGSMGSDMTLALDVMAIFTAVADLLYDSWAAAELQARSWPYVVLILDLLLVFDTPRMIPVILCLTLVYLLIERIEAGMRFGLYNLVASNSPQVCDCENPPCGLSANSGFNGWLISSLVLVTDFYLTRGFATDLRRQLRRVQSSVNVAANIAAALAKYDVDVAEDAVNDGSDLPEELSQSFNTLISILRSYKAYLPHSVLVSPHPSRTSAASPSTTAGWRSRLTSAQDCDSNVSSDSRVQTPRTEPTPRAEQPVPIFEHSNPEYHLTSLRATPRRIRVSLAVGNALGFLTLADDLAGQANADWMAADVEQWCSRVVDVMGVVDWISGDRREASFNARQACFAHSSAAMEVLSSRGQGHWSGCVVTGQVVCGDFGSVSVLRFMVLGGLSSSLHPIERIAAQWRIKVMADNEAYSSACYNWDGELLGAVFMFKRGNMPIRLYSIRSPRQRGEEGTEQSREWMYELASMGKQKYEEVNEAKEADIRARLVGTQVTSTEEEFNGVVWKVRDVGLLLY
eukprot:Hpha_TRINITY_DN16509_c1_g9::TRINITY_DN16509_c1_g9_i1::g.135381::m.135381